MKTKFYYLFIIILLSILFISCSTEKKSNTIYYYINNSSDDIYIKSIMPSYDVIKEVEKDFTILMGDKIKIVFGDTRGSYRLPFQWYAIREDDGYATVSNSRVEVEEVRDNNTELYDLSNYKLTTSKYTRTYTYIFTDAYFENGEPIE